MAQSVKTDWNRGSHASSVSIGTHHLFASVSGPDRQPGQPIVVLMHGLTSTMSEWPVARRLISSFARVLDYDRAGYGRSEESPNLPDAVNIAKELNALLDATGIDPPYVTVGHSWGGVLTMEFMDTRPQDIAGMVFVDAGVPHHFEVLPMIWREPDMMAMMADVDFVAVTGVKENTALSDDEWKAFLEEEGSEKHARQAGRENEVFARAYKALKGKGLLEKTPPLLGARPICVLRGNTDKDYEKMFHAGVAKGNGTQEQRAKMKEVLDGWEEKDTCLQKQFLQMSTRGHFIQAPLTSGHNIQLTDPHCIADAVRWTLDHLAG
jgi:pimeloyl-ACP methyl ester carboxylesterase